MPTPQELLNTQVEVSELFHIYGELLSDRQKAFIKLYYDENLSLSEIAAQHDISRQAVHDAIKHGRKALYRYEETLHLHEMKNSGSVGGRDKDWKRKIETILGEMENVLNESGDLARGRLRAQIASLRDLLEVRGKTSSRDEKEEEEAA
jgi:predicted DNA-binding protein YlxM (UPF0122 family)